MSRCVFIACNSSLSSLSSLAWLVRVLDPDGGLRAPVDGHPQRYVVFSVGWAVDGCREGLDVSNLITSVATGFSPSGGVPVTKVSRGNGDEFRADFVARGVDGPSLRFPRAARENAMWLIVRFRTNLGRLCQMNCRYDCGVRRWWCGLGEA